ncbi:MAG: 2-oxoacid:acceptor oxidoreductase subunit alpha [Methanobacterium sp.]|uniref:2-oxoacid:acceptor oxidoreductase subunit alpha n=1 Tax=Methanobacterium sp. TaxID=2164 RepID=UPI003D64C20F|nr:2-oxoacid:acceptor oxidoreductase subunit alpha [Methanobacterium sp.]
MSEFLSKEEVSIVLCGEAGQGIQTVETILVQTVKLGGYNVFSSKEYMSRVRGGENSTQIRVSSKKVAAYVDRIDILVAISKGAINHLKERVSPDTIIIGDEETLKDIANPSIIKIPFLKMAAEIGGPIFANIIAAGAISRILNIDKEIFDECIKSMFSRKGDKIVKSDLKAGAEGYNIGENIIKSGRIKIEIKNDPKLKDELLLNGTDVVGMGCIAGGCKFMSSYPMTPSTPLQVFIANNSKDFGIVFEQAEDEIAAINMGLGASYAGARSIVATSGSGFALMSEAVGLSGMIETPIVIYVGQRPGPAVGLPTRMAQEDLDLVLYSSPGETPKAIFAPGNFEDAFYVSWKAFNLAEKYQIPVFILSDQYFADIYYNLPSLSIDDVEIEEYIIKTDKKYKRYELTFDGVSPRGIPGLGDGLVCVDSDEHDEEGHLTEDLNLRNDMVEKRLIKIEGVYEDVIAPEFIGSPDYKILVVGWGSTYEILKEGIEKLERDDIALLQFKQVYPIHEDAEKYFKTAEKTVVFENNATSQFGNLIQIETGFRIHESVLKYDGMPFSVEEVTETLKSILEVEENSF